METARLLMAGYPADATVNDQPKNICRIEHPRHYSPANFMVHLIVELIVYTGQPKKPAFKFPRDSLKNIAVT